MLMPTRSVIFARPKVVASYVSKGKNETDLSTYSFASQNIGTPDSCRVVVVGIFFNAGGTVSCTGCTIDGVSATNLTSVVEGSGVSTGISLFALQQSSGSTATVAFTLSGVAVRGGIIVWNVLNKRNGVAPHHTTTAQASSPTTSTLRVPAQGCAIAAAFSAQSGTNSVTWTSAFNENVDELMGTTDNTYSAATLDFSQPSIQEQSVSATWGGAPTRPVLAAASWGA